MPDANTGRGRPAPCRRRGTGPFSGESDAASTAQMRDFRNLRNSPTTTDSIERPPDSRTPTSARTADNPTSDPGQNTAVDLGRLAWLGTVLACLIAVLVLVLQGYYGYAGVTFAVALAAGINLF